MQSADLKTSKLKYNIFVVGYRYVLLMPTYLWCPLEVLVLYSENGAPITSWLRTVFISISQRPSCVMGECSPRLRRWLMAVR